MLVPLKAGAIERRLAGVLFDSGRAWLYFFWKVARTPSRFSATEW
jgi:hypothetical protein